MYYILKQGFKDYKDFLIFLRFSRSCVCLPPSILHHTSYIFPLTSYIFPLTSSSYQSACPRDSSPAIPGIQTAILQSAGFILPLRIKKNTFFFGKTLDYFRQKPYLSTNRSRHRFSSERNAAYQGGPFFVRTYMKYAKPLLSIQQQIDILKQRGLLIENNQEARQALDTISYFRLAGYWRLMEADKTRHIFKEGSKFSQILGLYHFDEELRLLLFSVIQHIEVAVRARMIRIFAERHGAFWFMLSLHAARMEDNGSSIYGNVVQTLQQHERQRG